MKKYAYKAQDALEQAADDTQIRENEHMDQAWSILKEIIESAADKSLDDLFNAAKKVLEDMRNDERLSKYFQELGQYIERALHDEGYVLSRKASRRADELYDEGQQLLESNAAWKKDADQLMKELNAYSTAFSADPLTAELIDNLQALNEDLIDFKDQTIYALKGKADTIYSDLFRVLVPRIIATIRQIPMPRVEYTSEKLDVVIDDLKLESLSFIPDLVRITNHNDLALEQGYAAYACSLNSNLRLRVEGLRFNAKDIAYYFNHKSSSWFRRWEDSGLLSLDLSKGDGLCFDVELESASEDDRETFFTVSASTASISYGI